MALMEMYTNLFGKEYTEIQQIVKKLSLPPYSAAQICDWLYKKNADSVDKMTNLSKSARTALNKHYTIRHDTPLNIQVSSDGTKKYLFKTIHSHYIEAVYIPDDSRHTICISSQAGCKWGCSFCMTGKQGLQANLSAGEILSQITGIPEKDNITNIVYMGMGEPLDNLREVLKSLEILTSPYGYAISPYRITVSTTGLIPPMKVFLEKSNCHLAVSLHTPFAEERKEIMPVESVFPVSDVVETLKGYGLKRHRKLSFEYIMFKDFNDTRRHVNEIARLLNGLKCRINLIRFHPVPGLPLKSSDNAAIVRFRDGLSDKGFITTIRASRGSDILAACGLLSTRHLINNKPTVIKD